MFFSCRSSNSPLNPSSLCVNFMSLTVHTWFPLKILSTFKKYGVPLWLFRLNKSQQCSVLSVRGGSSLSRVMFKPCSSITNSGDRAATTWRKELTACVAALPSVPPRIPGHRWLKGSFAYSNIWWHKTAFMPHFPPGFHWLCICDLVVCSSPPRFQSGYLSLHVINTFQMCPSKFNSSFDLVRPSLWSQWVLQATPAPIPLPKATIPGSPL